MSQNYPKISVVTPSYNQGAFIEETIRSVMTQNYPNYEHWIIDGGSTDDTLEILRKYPHLRVVSEADNGQSDAINKGYGLASGEIIAWINSDDAYMPGTFERVVRELDRKLGHYVIMGRCIFVDEKGKPTGFEHPSAYQSRTRLLKIWKGHAIPQPSVFFYKEVLVRSGLLDEDLQLCMDYDLWIRMSQHYRFYEVDQIFSIYRFHDNSKSVQHSTEEVLEKAIEVSKKYWGRIYTPHFWNCQLSLILYRMKQPLELWMRQWYLTISLKRLVRQVRHVAHRIW